MLKRSLRQRASLTLVLLVAATAIACAAQAQPWSVYSDESDRRRDLTRRDVRLLRMRHTDTRFEMPHYESRGAWERRAGRLRRHIRVSTGLWPPPPRTPLRARVFDRTEGDGYTVEKVYFESYPDFFVAGNLYRPADGEGPHPGILSPHGHWTYGRTNNTERGSVPARAINLARQGHVVFAYDMVGYGDTRQVDHTFASDSLSQLWGISLLGLQLWNSMRSLDFLRSLPDVDAERLGITGASGGGTQTFLLTAVDTTQQLKVTAPVNMISAFMQGGDLCENAPGLRLNTFNVEVAALAAPRPQLMVSNTQDWTQHTPWVEYPMMQSIYRLYDAENRLGWAHFDYPHNYNEASREAVYPWMSRWLLGREMDAVDEKEISLDEEELLVFLKKRIGDPERSFDELPSDVYEAPPADMDAGGLKAYLKEQAGTQVDGYWPSEAAELDRFRQVYGSALRHMVAASVPDEVRVHRVGEVEGVGFRAEKMLLARRDKNDWIPVLWLHPSAPEKGAVLVADPAGKGALLQPGRQQVKPWVAALLEEGLSVLAIDAFQTGEHVLPEGTETQRDESHAFFTTFNRTDTQERVQDVLTAASFLDEDRQEVHLVGTGTGGVWALLAAALAGDQLTDVVAFDLPGRKRPEAALDYFVPGLLRVGGLRTAAALAAPTRLVVHGVEEGGMEGVKRVFEYAGAPARFQVKQGRVDRTDIADWLQGGR